MQRYIKPVLTKTTQGTERKVGFELEFSGLEVNETCRLIASVFSGKTSVESNFEAHVETNEFGAFGVELDWHFGKKLAKTRGLKTESIGTTDGQDALIQTLTSLVGQIVPIEIVCPPIPLSQLDRLDPLIEQLRQAGAKGTDESPVYAFGVHINTEVPDSSPLCISRYLQAYCLAQEWLVKTHKVDLTRRLTPYVDLYPDEYLHTVLAYDDSIDLKTLIDDYLSSNCTRNRALDMLPLFRHLDEKRVDNAMEDDLTNGRPTFHYRLPNCEINKDGWQLNDSWNIWCVIEYLAAHENLLNTLIAAWQEHDANVLFPGQPPWHEDLNQLLVNLESG